jgi:hypothetical protein
MLFGGRRHQTVFWCDMKSLCSVATFLFAGTLLCAGQGSAEVVGCVTQMPIGGVQLQAQPSGSVFLLQSTPAVLQHLNELVRVRIPLSANGTRNLVDELELVDQSCASVLPAQRPVAVVGKVGEPQMAVPITSSHSADETTPGFQTESIIPQEPPNSGRVSAIKKANLIYAPRNIGQAAQSAAIADIYAQSATRTEILPGNTLGIETMPDYSAASENRIKAEVSRRK